MERKEELLNLYKLWKNRELTDKNKNFFWYKNKEYAAYIFIFSLAKFCTLNNKNCNSKEVIDLKNFIISLQEYYFNFYKNEIVEEPILNGKEIMSILGLSSGKEIGKIKEELLKKQIEGLIKNKNEAIDFVKKYIEKVKG